MSPLARAVEDLDAYVARDPAATGRAEVALTYPGLHAIWLHRVAHRAWRRGWRLPARLIALGSRFLTGVEIHPGARLGRRLVIDHGRGIVIGETAQVGDDVTIYHRVTLGGTASRPVKRHPTVGDRVLLGAGATVLGPVTVGHDARIGATALVVDDVPAGAVIKAPLGVRVDVADERLAA